MHDDGENFDEFELRSLFGRNIPPVADEGFSRAVQAGIRRRIWRRRLILLTAGAAGLALAVPVMMQWLVTLSADLVALTSQAEGSNLSGSVRALLSLLPVGESVDAASTDLKQLAAQTWLRRYQMYLLAGLLAVASLVTARVLER